MADEEENKGENIDSVQADPMAEKVLGIEEEKEAPTVDTQKSSEEELPEEIELEEKTEEPKEAKPAMPAFAKNLNMPNFRIPKISLRELPSKIAHTLREYRRVIIVSKKPDVEELSKISKVAALGIALIGFIGFIIQIVFQLIKLK